MRELFGTDGVRGRANSHPMTAELALKIGAAAGRYFRRDQSRAHRVVRAMKAGRVWINSYGDADPVMAFGGYKQSGLGREYGQESIEAYTQVKSVWARL